MLANLNTTVIYFGILTLENVGTLMLQIQYLLQTHKISFNDFLMLKISVYEHLTCKIQSSNDIFEIKQSLNKKISFNISLIPYCSVNFIHFQCEQRKC
jgi:hypothetical protein